MKRHTTRSESKSKMFPKSSPGMAREAGASWTSVAAAGCALSSLRVVQHFEVWGYTVEEVLKITTASGFVMEGICEHLDFAERTGHGDNPFCLNFRARLKEDR